MDITFVDDPSDPPSRIKKRGRPATLTEEEKYQRKLAYARKHSHEYYYRVVKPVKHMKPVGRPKKPLLENLDEISLLEAEIAMKNCELRKLNKHLRNKLNALKTINTPTQCSVNQELNKD